MAFSVFPVITRKL